MNINANKPILRKNLPLILENMKTAKLYLQQGKISSEDLKKLIEVDPTDKRKFIGWIAKIWIKNDPQPTIHELRSYVEEYNTFLNRGRAKTKDIYQFKTFEELKKEVDQLNQTGQGITVKDLERDFETIKDDKDLLIMVPHTHEASRKLGLAHFSYRDCGEDGKKDSAWCTTYKSPSHFNSYYYSQNVTFYYVKVRSKKMIDQLKQAFPSDWQPMMVTALVVHQSGRIEGYDGTDSSMGEEKVKKYLDILGIS